MPGAPADGSVTEHVASLTTTGWPDVAAPWLRRGTLGGGRCVLSRGGDQGGGQEGVTHLPPERGARRRPISAF